MCQTVTHYTMLPDIDNRNAVDILYESGLNVITVGLCISTLVR